MANSPIAVDRLESLQIALKFPTEVAFDQNLVRGDRLDDVIQLFRRKALRANIGVDIRLLEDFFREARSDSIDIWKGRFDSLITWDFYAKKTRHVRSFLMLVGAFEDQPCRCL